VTAGGIFSLPDSRQVSRFGLGGIASWHGDVRSGAFLPDTFFSRRVIMQLSVWSPFREREDFFNQVQRNFLGRALSASPSEPTEMMWAPVVDISETAKEYILRAEVPGIPKDAVKITVEDGVLTLTGERRVEKEHRDEKHHRVERAYGSFTRSFALPSDVEDGQIAADYKDGILSIRLPRTAAKKAKPIEVRVH